MPFSFSGEIPVEWFYVVAKGFFSLSCSGSIICARYFQYSDFFWVALRYILNDVQSVSLWNFLALLHNRWFLFIILFFYVFSSPGE